MKDYVTASVPVLCKNGAWGDASSGRKIRTEAAIDGVIQYTSESRVTLNQKLKEKAYGYTIDTSEMTALCFEVYEASRINKHGLIWEKVYSAVFRPRDRCIKESMSCQLHADYWLGPDGVALLSKSALVRVADIPPVVKIVRKMWNCDNTDISFPDDPLELLRAWIRGELEARIREMCSIIRRICKYQFGMEVEFTGISRDAAARAVARVLGTVKHYMNDSYHTHEIYDYKQRKWKIVRDSSIAPVNSRNTAFNEDHYRCELVTPILKYNSDIKLLRDIISSLKQRGAVTNSSCGIHIHVDTHFNARQLRNLTNIVASKEGLLKRAIQMNPERHHYCRNTNMSFVETINAHKKIDMDAIRNIWYGGEMWRMNQHYDPSRYVTLNLHSLWQGKGVEFRCFNSTMDMRLINTYILMTLAICNQAARQTRASCHESKSNDRVAMYNWLTQLGLVGTQFEALRHHFMGNLSANERSRVA